MPPWSLALLLSLAGFAPCDPQPVAGTIAPVRDAVSDAVVADSPARRAGARILLMLLLLLLPVAGTRAQALPSLMQPSEARSGPPPLATSTSALAVALSELGEGLHVPPNRLLLAATPPPASSSSASLCEAREHEGKQLVRAAGQGTTKGTDGPEGC